MLKALKKKQIKAKIYVVFDNLLFNDIVKVRVI